MSVKDGGMMLVTALTPDLRWQSGAAELTLSLRGAKSQPQACAITALCLRQGTLLSRWRQSKPRFTSSWREWREGSMMPRVTSTWGGRTLDSRGQNVSSSA